MRLLSSITPFFLTLNLSANAWAQAAPGTPPNPIQGLLVNAPIFLALFALFYFGMIRPQRQQQKQQQQFLSNLKVGDEVTTAAGIIGTIRGLTDRVVTLDVGDGTELKMLRSQIQSYFKDAMSGAQKA